MGQLFSTSRNEKPERVPNVTQTIANVKHQLGQCLESLESLGPSLSDSLHHDHLLPKPANMNLSAEAIDILHNIQLMLDPPALILADHFLGYVRSKCLLAAVQRGIPDALEKMPMSLDELAEITHSHRDRLGQVMHILRNQGIFVYNESDRRYYNSPASSLLLSNHWTQWHNWVSLYGTQFYDIARGIPDSTIKNAPRTAAQVNYDTDCDMFTFFREQQWVPQLLQTLGGGATAQLPGMLADYPWHEVANGLVMDIGGGGGDFIAGLLRKYPKMQGGLFDQPHAIEHFRQSLALGGKLYDIKEQVRDENIVAGNFFESIPRCTVYTMKWCLHDWKDPEAILILKNIRDAIVPGPHNRLIVFESVISDRHSDRLSHYGDINMMMTINGQERSKDDWERLAKASGWELEGMFDLRRAWVKALDFRLPGC
ncbi:S-adenosyl-L-methionine-dependent methyltransferase [Xylaria grammica]|nr:S-adenosyl-L-methionine-dependent methyltransferase [Xylaria grammica]